MLHIAAVQVVERFKVRLLLGDGTQRIVDLRPYLVGPVFEPLVRDRALFAQVRVDPEWGCLEWPNGADIDTEVLVEGLQPAAWDR